MEGSVSGLIIGPLTAQSSILRFMMPFQFDLCDWLASWAWAFLGLLLGVTFQFDLSDWFAC